MATTGPRTHDAAGRPIIRTRDGYGYVVSDTGRWYVSECCGSPATISMGVMSCKGCYAEVDEILGAIPQESPSTP